MTEHEGQGEVQEHGSQSTAPDEPGTLTHPNPGEPGTLTHPNPMTDPNPGEPGTLTHPMTAPVPGEPGSLTNPIQMTDPQMMRALAHQARIAIWLHLGLHGPATATECAEVAGLSPSACSYHLRTLARYGFVVEDRASAADGRERPWRARMVAFEIQDGADQPAVTQVASQLLVENMRASAEEVRARYVARKSEFPADWRAAAGEMFSVAHVTPDELNQMRERVMEVMAQYIRMDPAERPPGALPVRIMLDLFPWFGPEEARKHEHGEEA